MHDILKQNIKQKLLTKNGNINSAILRRDWFKQSDLYKSLFELTSFLPNESSLSERIFCILKDITESPKCVVCKIVNKPFSFVDRGHYCDTCSSPSCKSTHSVPTRQATLIERYGSLASDKHRESARSRSGELFTKGRQTFLENYGTFNVSSLPHVKEQKKQTNLEKYGVPHWNQGSESKEKTRQQRFEKYQKYGAKQIIDPTPKMLEKYAGPNYRVQMRCLVCNYEEIVPFDTLDWRFSTYGSHCANCLGINVGSAQQQEVFNFIQSIMPDATQSNRSILQSMELDIFIPSLNIAFEYNGIYWHSYNKPETPKQKNYHLFKQDKAREQGISLYRIWESEWVNKQDIVKSKIMAILKKTPNVLQARKCEVRKIDKDTKNSFLLEHHMQGSDHSTDMYGLFHNNELQSVMTFGKSRFDKNVQYEMFRFCNKKFTTIVGGANRLFKAFIRDINPLSVVTFSDRRWGEGLIYNQLGFKHIHNTSPNYFYYQQGKTVLHSRQKFQKHKQKELLAEFDDDKTEAENMFLNDWRRIWDCGNAKWVWTPA